MSADLKWTTHIDHVCSKASKRLFAIRILKRNGAEQRDLRNFYCSFIRPVLEYACPVWHFSLPGFLSDQLEQIQRRVIRIINPNLSCKDGLNELNLPTLADRRDFCVKDFTRKTLVLQATFPTCYLSRTHIHIILELLETLGTLHFLRHVLYKSFL